MQRNQFIRAALGAALFSLAAGVLAQSYPSRSVRVIIPFPPGGTLDFVGRALAQKLSEQTGQPFVVENRPGGQGTIGARDVSGAAADGYTLLFSASTFATAPMTMKSAPYNVTRDFAPVALVAKAPLAVSVNKNLPITDIKSLLAYAKAHPGKMTFAIGSTGSAGHLSTELLKSAGGFDYLVVPYKGSSPAYTDLIGGQIDCFVDPVLGATSFNKGGLLRIVAVTSKARLPILPGVPTVGETIPGYEFYSWYGLWGPAKMPPALTQRLNAEVNKALASGMRDQLLSQGVLPGGGTSAEFARFQQEDMARSAKIISAGHIHVE